MINANAIRHPRTQVAIKRAMLNAVRYGAAIAMSAKGREIVSAFHDRTAVPAFSFWRDHQDVTGEFLNALRGSVNHTGEKQ